MKIAVEVSGGAVVSVMTPGKDELSVIILDYDVHKDQCEDFARQGGLAGYNGIEDIAWIGKDR